MGRDDAPVTAEGRRVVLVHYTFPGTPGGVELVVAQHARALRDAGALVTLVAGRGRPTIQGVDDVRIDELDSRHPSVVAVGEELARGSVGPAYGAVRDAIGARLAPVLASADRVVLHNVATLPLNLPLVAALHDLAPGLPSGRLRVWVHDLADADPRYRAVLQTGVPWDLLHRPLSGARYVAISEVRRRETAASLGLAPGSIAVVPNGVDVGGLLGLSPSTVRLLARLGLADTEERLVLPVRITARKRIELAIEAVACLRDMGRDARLVVTGAPDPHGADHRAYLDSLRAAVARQPAAAILAYDVLHRELPRRRLVELYRASDAVLLTSESEGFGIPVAEAAALGAPIVCSDLPVLREIAGDDATYVALEAGPEAWAGAIATALDADRSARLARRARRDYDLGQVLVERVLPAILDD
jgi:glycosyltransferase involved in cell wall biosynthesis